VEAVEVDKVSLAVTHLPALEVLVLLADCFPCQAVVVLAMHQLTLEMVMAVTVVVVVALVRKVAVELVAVAVAG
jgi:hypothetical protein